MKQSILFAVFFFCYIVYGNSQQGGRAKDSIRNLVDNATLKAVEYTSMPGGDACGKGLHGHPAHLTVFLTDATIQLTDADGKAQQVTVKTGFTLWSEAGTHMAINNGKKPVQVILVETK